MDRMGHAQITTTQKYLHPLPDADTKNLDALNRIRGQRGTARVGEALRHQPTHARSRRRLVERAAPLDVAQFRLPLCVNWFASALIIDLTPIRDGSRPGTPVRHGRRPHQAGVQAVWLTDRAQA